MKQLVILGSTGSIGTSCLDVVRAGGNRWRIAGLTAHRSTKELARQCEEFSPRFAVVSDETAPRPEFPSGTDLRYGPEGLSEVASHPDVDLVMAGIVGAAGLRGTWSAIQAGKTIGLANKETLVVAGPLAIAEAERTGATIIPVDSEHSAIFQALQTGKRDDVARVILTASGGPFRGWSRKKLETVTPTMALAHPTWEMGPKITIDSATMMNKALEIIEARWLFRLQPDQISVVVHPQSVAHSFVEFRDGSVIGQFSPPDMKLPIQLAMSWPDRWESPSTKMNWQEAFQLDFEPPDFDAFPALQLGFDVARSGGTSGAVLNAANEAAVDRFLAGDLRFVDIPHACRAVLENHTHDSSPELEELFRLDRWAREEVARWTI